MVQSFKHSYSLGYIITNWYEKLKTIHKDYLKSNNELFDSCINKIHLLIIDLLKNLGKESLGVLNVKYNEIILTLKNNSLNFFELKETMLNYKLLLDEIRKNNLTYNSIPKLKNYLITEIEKIQTINVLIRNAIKAGALVFAKKKPARKNVDDLILHLKNYNRFINNVNREILVQKNILDEILSELTNEVKITIEQEHTKERIKDEIQK